MARPPAVSSLRLRNLLSFGPDAPWIELRPLNVLIGPNGSGKSNLIEAMSLLKAAPGDLLKAIREGGGVGEWLWKGAADTPTATIEATVDYQHGDPDRQESPLGYCLSFSRVGQRFEVTDERIENQLAWPDGSAPLVYFSYLNGRPTLLRLPTDHQPGRLEPVDATATNPPGQAYPDAGMRLNVFDIQQSVLAQRRDPEHYPEVSYLAELLDSFRLYRNWSFGRDPGLRRPQRADLPNDFLLEDATNLGLIVSRLHKNPSVKRAIREHIRVFYEDADEVDVIIEGGTVQVFLQEKWGYIIPASRLSDGTLRWIALLTILLHPSPPPLVCIEEPELGLHPDMIPTLATLLHEASERMQLIITTHSRALVDEFTETPEAIVVCDKENGTTKLDRLNRKQMSVWLDKYTLGELWGSGEIGANRW